MKWQKDSVSFEAELEFWKYLHWSFRDKANEEGGCSGWERAVRERFTMNQNLLPGHCPLPSVSGCSAPFMLIPIVNLTLAIGFTLSNPSILEKQIQCHLHASDKTTSFGSYCFILRAHRASYWRLVTSFLLSTQCLSLQDRVKLIPLLIKMHAFTSDNSYLEWDKCCNLQKFDPFSPTWKLLFFFFSTITCLLNSNSHVQPSVWISKSLTFFPLFLFYANSEGRR